jgi:hypothetical protein
VHPNAALAHVNVFDLHGERRADPRGAEFHKTDQRRPRRPIGVETSMLSRSWRASSGARTASCRASPHATARAPRRRDCGACAGRPRANRTAGGSRPGAVSRSGRIDGGRDPAELGARRPLSGPRSVSESDPREPRNGLAFGRSLTTQIRPSLLPKDRQQMRARREQNRKHCSTWRNQGATLAR